MPSAVDPHLIQYSKSLFGSLLSQWPFPADPVPQEPFLALQRMAIENTMKPKTLQLIVFVFFPHSFGHGWAMGDSRPKLRLLPVIESSENQTQTPACYIV
jgi:hypothetical protein